MIVYALYGRTSSKGQEERETIQLQKDFLHHYVQLYNLSVNGEYWDGDVNGTIPLHERPGGRRLFQAAKQKKFTGVLFYQVDRLARSLRVLINAYEDLDKLGVSLRSAQEPFDTNTQIGKVVFQLLGIFAEFEKANILERTRNGRDTKLKDGRWPGGVIQYGYTLDTNHFLIPYEPEAAIIRELYERIDHGSTVTAEAARLNVMNILPTCRYKNGVIHRAKKWYPSRVSRMLHSTTYIGNHVFKSKNEQIAQKVIPLVDIALWERVQTKIADNQRFGTSPNIRQYLLRGLLHCGHCGNHYSGQVFTPERAYYRCGGRDISTRQLTQRCPGKSLRTEQIDDVVWERCLYILEHPEETLQKMAEQWNEKHAKAPSTTLLKQRLQKALADKALERERTQMMFRKSQGKHMTFEEWERAMDDIAREESELQTQLNTVLTEEQITTAFDTYLTDTLTLLGVYRENLAKIREARTFEEKRPLVECLLHSVILTTQENRTIRAVFHYIRGGIPIVIDFPTPRNQEFHYTDEHVFPVLPKHPTKTPA
jgi:site-specific DNA recombinase